MNGLGQCVMVLHRLVERPSADHDVRWDSFVGLLGLLERLEIEVRAELRPGDSAALTFDDATADHLDAAEELARRGIPATFFVPVTRIGRPGSLDADGLRRIASLGHRVGAHGLSHRPLAGLDADALREEVGEARVRLEAIVDDVVDLFAPPGGIGHPLLERTLRESGFVASRSTRWGLYTTPASRWQIPAVPVTEVTLGRGWIREVLDARSLPSAMRVAWIVKQAVPPRLANAARTLAHRNAAR